MTRHLRSYWNLNIYYFTLPFLVLYILICASSTPSLDDGDTARYISFAHNILNGFYSPPYPDIKLWNGPGYPLTITPPLFLSLPILSVSLLNALFLYLALIVNYKSFLVFSSRNTALIFTILLGLYFPVYSTLRLIYPESLAWLLLSIICYLISRIFENEAVSWKHILLCAVAIAYLALTKILFGYVIVAMVFVSILLLLFRPFVRIGMKMILIFFVSLLFCLPYLIYTYSLTKNLFYWGNSGGSSLYWMSSPYEDDLGDWNPDDLRDNPKLIENHKAFIDSISMLNPIEQDKAFKTKSIENIKTHPIKYLSNWVANVGRLFYGYPYSYARHQKIWFYDLAVIIVNGILISIVLLLLYPLFYLRKRIPPAIYVLSLFIITYLFASSLLSAYLRMFYITVPFWFLLISYAFSNVLKIRINTSE